MEQPKNRTTNAEAEVDNAAGTEPKNVLANLCE